MFGKEEALFNLYVGLGNINQSPNLSEVEITPILGLSKVFSSGRLVRGYDPNLHTVSVDIDIKQGREGHLHTDYGFIKYYKIGKHGNVEIEVWGESPYYNLNGLYRKNSLSIEQDSNIPEKMEVLFKELKKYGVKLPPSAPCEIYERLYKEKISDQ